MINKNKSSSAILFGDNNNKIMKDDDGNIKVCSSISSSTTTTSTTTTSSPSSAAGDDGAAAAAAVTTTSTTYSSCSGPSPSTSSSGINLFNDFKTNNDYQQSSIKLIRDEEIFYNDLISIIFGSSEYILGKSNKFMLYFDNPMSRIDNNKKNTKYISELIKLAKVLYDGYQKRRQLSVCSMDNNDDDGVIIITALKPFPLTLLLNIDYENDSDNDFVFDNPFSLYDQLIKLDLGHDDDDDSTAILTEILSQFEKGSKDTDSTAIVQDSKNLFQCIMLFCEKHNHDKHLVENFFPISFHATPSCFSILPYLLFQQCNQIFQTTHQIVDDDNDETTQITSDDHHDDINMVNNTTNNNEQKIWGILSNYKLFGTNNSPSIFCPSLAELIQQIDITNSEGDDCFIWLKNGNFRAFRKGRMQQSFKKSLADLVKNLETLFVKNMEKYSYSYHGDNFFVKYDEHMEKIINIVDISKDEDENEVDDDDNNNCEKYAKKINEKEEESSFCFNLSKSFKKFNPLFCCFDYYNTAIQSMRCRNQLKCLLSIQNNISLLQTNEEFYPMNYNPINVDLFYKHKKMFGVYHRLFTKEEWLCDACVNFVIHLLIVLEKMKPTRFVLLANFYESSLNNKYNFCNKVEDLLTAKSGNIKKKCLDKYRGFFNKSLWIIPMFLKPNHWRLFLVVSPNLISEKKCTILILDSLHHNRETLSEYEENEVLKLKLYISECFNYVNSQKNYAVVFNSITVYKLMDAKQQTDGNRCGWFCIMNAKFAVGTTYYYLYKFLLITLLLLIHRFSR
jgi:hypothetical protein